jgi:L-cysteine S-thiosulfotransferase
MLRHRRIGLGVAAVCALAALARAASEPEDAARGREIAHDPYKGNCLACHQIPDDPLAVSMANLAPPLVKMKERFPDRGALRAQIWDSAARNPMTIMPPFGKHGVLTEEEIDLVLAYIYRY